MTQGQPIEKARESAELGRTIARRADTLHILCHVLRSQARARGDAETAALIDYVFDHVREGDSVKLWLMSLIET